jgi:hypothetical protein
MPFCNQCGSPLEGGADRCPVCGRSTTAAPAPASSSQVPARGHSGKRFVPIFLVAVVLLGVILMGGVLLLYYHARSGMQTKNGPAEITSPFGKIASGQDALKVARDLRFPVYPGSTRADSNSATEINSMGGQVATMSFVTPDPVANVMAFYRARFPGAEVKTQSDQHGSLNYFIDGRVTNVDAQWDGAQTQIQVSIVQHQ